MPFPMDLARTPLPARMRKDFGYIIVATSRALSISGEKRERHSREMTSRIKGPKLLFNAMEGGHLRADGAQELSCHPPLPRLLVKVPRESPADKEPPCGPDAVLVGATEKPRVIPAG